MALLSFACDGKDGLLTAVDEVGASAGTADPNDVSAHVAGPCEPNNADCASDLFCCSDDPATVGGKIPNYFNGIVDATHDVPIFSGANNDLGTSGRCVNLGGYTTPLANGCPAPCNPTWDLARTAEICGEGLVCCQTTTIDPDKDCIIDPVTQRWRAVTGHDLGLTTWGDRHTTNQDPLGSACGILVAGANGMVDPGERPALEDCYAQLSVADQRGFCYAASACPCQEDLCDIKNPGWVPRCE